MVAKPELVAALPRGASLQARSVDVYVHRLRMRLREQAVEGLAIEAVRGRGWLLRLGTPEFAATAA
jgi:DNA-binding response OmpR family regulator